MLIYNYKYIYGPIESWRLGKSLGIDPLSCKSKICNLDCVYCQLGRTACLSSERKLYVPSGEILREINLIPPILNFDYFTFSGRGEPTLASNLGEMIKALKNSKKQRIAVITNSTLMYLPEVRDDLSHADYVVAKLDAFDEASFSQVDKPEQGVSFKRTLEGIKSFKKIFPGKLAIQIMFVEQNKGFCNRIARVVREINADEVQINTPLRPSAAKPIDREEINRLKVYFAGMPFVSVFDHDREETAPLNSKDTIKRHGNFKIKDKVLLK